MHALNPEALTRHIDRLYRSAWALCGSREDAEDLVQETFARVLAKPRTLREGTELPYLLSALRNTFLSGRRAAARRPKAVAELDVLALRDERGTHMPEQALQAREVYAAIAALPVDFRLVLVAVDVAGLSYREAGELLGVAEDTVATRLYRARRKVAQAFTEPPATPVQAHDNSGVGDQRELALATHERTTQTSADPVDGEQES